MADTDRISAKEIIAVVVVLVLMGIGIFLTLGLFAGGSQQTEVAVSEAGAKKPDHVEVFIKMLSIDPIKGDTTARLEFVAHGGFIGEDGTLTRDLKLYIPSANGKTEVDFKKGKSMPPVEAVFSMYGGNAANYPFDAHKADFYVYIDQPEPDKKEQPKPAPTPAEDDEAAPTAAQKDAEPETPEVPLDISFFGSIPGYKLTVEKGSETDETFVEGTVSVARSSTVVAFSLFVTALMWLLSLGVLFLTVSVLFRGRKPELGMFSFMAALLFAFYAVRNSQPNVPPIGVYSDFTGFFWAEILVGSCLLLTVFTWVFRPSK
jgi:hypothetical protein